MSDLNTQKQRVKELIQAKQYDKARAILKTMPDAKSQELLVRLNQKYPPQLPRKDTQSVSEHTSRQKSAYDFRIITSAIVFVGLVVVLMLVLYPLLDDKLKLPFVGLVGATGLLFGLAIYGNWLNQKKEAVRLAKIESKRNEWGTDVCEILIKKQIVLEMTPEMVRLSWGDPSNVDQQEVTKTGINKMRWVYGTPRKGAKYLYFKQGKLDKIQG